MVDINPALIVKSCRDLYKTNPDTDLKTLHSSSLYKLVSKSLRAYLLYVSKIQNLTFKDWTVDEKNPGYLLKMEGHATTRAPYHIVPAFPDRNTLEGVWEVSRNIKTHDASVLCLSGSMALLRASILSSDLDFCEYIPSAKEGIQAFIFNKTRDTEHIIFQRLRFGSNTWDSDSDNASIVENLHEIDPHSATSSYGKIDYIANVRGMRPSDVSNVMIFCDPKWQSKSLERTFAAQEVLLDASIGVPNNMNEPMAMGRYVDWLFREMTVQSDKGMFEKAIKRGLSLSRVCFIPSLSEKISGYIKTSKAFLQKELLEINKLEEKLSKSNSDTASRWLNALKICKSKTEAALGDNHEWSNEPCDQFHATIFKEFDDYFSSRKPASWS